MITSKSVSPLLFGLPPEYLLKTLYIYQLEDCSCRFWIEQDYYAQAQTVLYRKLGCTHRSCRYSFITSITKINASLFSPASVTCKPYLTRYASGRDVVLAI